MGRLKSLPPRLASLPPRVAAAPKIADRFYQSPEWRAYRSAHARWTRARLGGLWCEVCGSTRRLVLDHRVERKDGGTDLPEFEAMGWLCHAHHQAKTARERAARASGGRG